MLPDRFKSCHCNNLQNFVMPTDIVGIVFDTADVGGPPDVVAVNFFSSLYIYDNNLQ